MILERLLDFHAATDALIPASLKKQPVRWLLDLGGEPTTWSDEHEAPPHLLIESGASKKEWTVLVTPDTKRSSQTLPLLLVDKPDYVLGCAVKPTQSQEDALKRHAAYVALVRECADVVQDSRLVKYLGFLDNHKAVARVRELAQKLAKREKSPMKEGDLIAPRIDADFLSNIGQVRHFWIKKQDDRAVEKSGLVSECMVTGDTGPIAQTHPVRLPKVGKGLVDLVSGNWEAFLSYGLKQSQIAPMSFTAARMYGEALRHLLSEEKHHLRTGGVTWLYWTREPVDDPLFAVKEADPVEVERLLCAPLSANADATVTDTDFYALAVSANVSRMVVRSWITTSLSQMQANTRVYFQRQRLVDHEGVPRYHKIRALAASLVPVKKGNPDWDKLPDQTTAALLDTALWGRPLPVSLLHAALQRARAEREHVLTHPRAALIKLVLLSNYPERYPMTDTLNPNLPDRAYQCGRLLAVLDNVQQKAVGARATLVDRYYGAASATPASVFGVLMRNAQNHLGKIRKTKGGLAYHFDQQIAQIAALLGTSGFPRTLTLEEQGLFALGFYQERNRPSQKTADQDAGADSEAS